MPPSADSPCCHVCLGDPPAGRAADKALARRVPVLRVVQVRRAVAGDRPLTCPHRAAALARHLLAGYDREAFAVIHLDHKRRAISAEVVAVGTLCATLVHPREVFKGALLANASAIVLAHNHPSGDPVPSPEDLALTRVLLAAGDVIGVTVEDHLVVGDTVVSMREMTGLWAART